jgi:mannose-6-phosphate isomerase-like protein (cupin superfamily)
MTIEPATRTFAVDIVAAARANDLFRRVLSTGPHAQVVLMSIPPGGEIGDEVHGHIDQVFTFVEGNGVAIVDGVEYPLGPNRLLHVMAGSRHNVLNRGVNDLRLYTVYAPPQHAAGTIHRTKAEADADESDHAPAATDVVA